MRESDKRRIMREDEQRRAMRTALDDESLGLVTVPDPLSDRAKIAANTKTGAYVNACLVRGIGTVNPPLPTSASRNQWDRGMSRTRTVGIAPGTEATSDGTPTVRVTKGGVVTIVPASQFRPARSTRSAVHVTRETHTPESARLAPIDNYTQDA